MSATPLDILRQYWGYAEFRPAQAEIIDSVLAGDDTLALLPTGGGKSVCFQVPALAREGICIVVSPLIALMKDQVENLVKRGIKAVAIYSGLHRNDIDRIFDNCVYGDIKFLYLSPERLLTELARVRIGLMKVNLIAVDEAHCVSQWGYDFRPPYLQIAEIRELHPEVPVIALTATATPKVATDIQEQLAFKAPNLIQRSFARSNLAYLVFREERKEDRLFNILEKVPGSGVVYVRNRKRTRSIAQRLQQRGISADYYHAGLRADERSARQDAWIAGKTRVIVSTNAFGMGIDKPDVRTVVHLDLPDSLEAYFQEAGRAGRDGQKAYAVLLYEESDKQRLKDGLARQFPPISEARRVYRALGSYFQLAVGTGINRSFDFDLMRFVKTYQLSPLTTFSALKMLEQNAYISLTDAVYTPATIRILVSKEKLYDYQLRNRELETLLRALLQVTEGAFRYHVTIREYQLAAFLKIPGDKLRAQLRTLQSQQIIEYRPTKDAPQLTYLTDRLDVEQLYIDAKLYRFRKERYAYRVAQAIEYVQRNVCRSRQLLQYFGELDTLPCGQCDVCLLRKSKGLSPADLERYRTKIHGLLRREQLTREELLNSFGKHRQAAVQEALNYLLTEEVVREAAGKLKWAG